MTPIPPAKPSASVLSCKPGIKRKVNEKGWPSMRKEFLNGKDPSHESQRKFRGHITDFFWSIKVRDTTRNSLEMSKRLDYTHINCWFRKASSLKTHNPEKL